MIASHSPSWESALPWAVVFGRGLGDGSSLVEVLQIPPVRIATVVYMPCFVLSWPISRWAPNDFYVADIDAQGLRLLVITVLSFLQWIAVLELCFAIRDVLKGRRRQM